MVVATGEGATGISRVKRARMLSTPECTGRSVTKNYPAQYVKSATAEKTYSTPCIFERGENWFLMTRKI